MRRLYVLGGFLLACVVVGVVGCCKKDDDGVVHIPSSGAYEKLSEYGFYQGNMADLVPVDGVVPYDLNSTLFTDYSLKQRFVYIPAGKQAVYDEQEAFDFPDGSVLIKNFYYLADFRDQTSTKRILETRLLMKRNGQWEAETYLWNDAQTEATRFIAGKSITVSWIDESGASKTTQYLVPNKNECKGCHERDADVMPIGPKARHLNRDYNYDIGTTNQLEYWDMHNMISGMPGSGAAPVLPVWNNEATGTLDQRARAYLDINCGHCHNPRGPANNSGLHLEYHVTNPAELGLCKSPVAAGNGSGGRLYDIVPGDADGSIMVYRMEVNDPEIRMPELGRSIEHAEAVQLIKDWINAMPGDCN